MNKETTTDELATMVKQGFNNIEGLFKQGFANVEKRINNLEAGQEEILLKLDNKADRFEVKDLQKRMKRVEGELGL